MNECGKWCVEGTLQDELSVVGIYAKLSEDVKVSAVRNVKVGSARRLGAVKVDVQCRLPRLYRYFWRSSSSEC